VERIVFLDRGTVAPQIRMGNPSFAHAMVEYDQTEPGQVVARAKDATILISKRSS